MPKRVANEILRYPEPGVDKELTRRRRVREKAVGCTYLINIPLIVSSVGRLGPTREWTSSTANPNRASFLTVTVEGYRIPTVCFRLY